MYAVAFISAKQNQRKLANPKDGNYSVTLNTRDLSSYHLNSTRISLKCLHLTRLIAPAREKSVEAIRI